MDSDFAKKLVVLSALGLSISSLHFYLKKRSAKKFARKYSFTDPTTDTAEFTKYMGKKSKEFNASKSLENLIPRKIESDEVFEKFLLKRFNYSRGEADLAGINEALLTPTYDLMDRGGKRWRPIICEFTCNLSEVRRGQPAIHLIYGVDISVNLSSFLYNAALNSLLQNSKIEPKLKIQLLESAFMEMTHIHIGQGWDIYWHKKVAKGEHPIPNVAQYMEMVSNKTGVLARMAVKFTCIMLKLGKEITEMLVDFAEALGVGFQIQDDILNLTGQEYSGTKGLMGEDIHEGKISLIVIHSLNNSTPKDKTRLLEILSLHTEDGNLIAEAINLMKKTKSIAACSEIGKKVVVDAWRKVRDYIPDSPSKSVLYSLALYCVERQI